MRQITGMTGFFSVVVIAIVVVIFAMIIDLISGLNKAKQRGEIRSSWGLKRTLSKFISYVGSLLIATGVDVLVQLGNIFVLLRLDAMYDIPIFTCLIAVFLLIVEFLSIREKADEKTRTEMSRAAEIISKCVTKDELVDALKAVLDSQRMEEHQHRYHEERHHHHHHEEYEIPPEE